MFMMADEQLVEAWYRRIFYQYVPSYAEKLPVHQSFVGVRRKYRRRRNWKQKIPKAGTGKIPSGTRGSGMVCLQVQIFKV